MQSKIQHFLKEELLHSPSGFRGRGLSIWLEISHRQLQSFHKLPGAFDKLYLLLQERAIPALVDIIRAPDTHSPVLVEGALDVLAALLRPSTPEQAAKVHSAASSHVMTLALHQDDAAILQSCSEYLRCILLACGQPAS